MNGAIEYQESDYVVSNPRSRKRDWVFTLNNWTEEEYGGIIQAIEQAKYGIVGKEVGEEGTPHLQGYIYFKNAKTFAACKTALGTQRVYLAWAKGNSLQNRVYCSKQGDFYEHGDRPLTQEEKGVKGLARYEEALQAAKEGRVEDIPADMLTRYYSTYKRVAVDYARHTEFEDDVTGIWWWGEPGTGKSFKARQDYPNAYIKNSNKWWDGYRPLEHDSAIIDDFDCAGLGHLLKIWADRYPFVAEVKCGTLFIRPKKIIVTSNYTIDEIFKDDAMLAKAIKRRFRVTHFNNMPWVYERANVSP